MSDENVDFELLHKVIVEDREETRALRQDIGAMRNEMREGFASLKAHDYSVHMDIQNLERRVYDLEDQIERLNKAQGINAGTDA